MDTTEQVDYPSLEELPDEILTLIMEFLKEPRTYQRGDNPWRNLMPITLVSRRINRLATSPRLWSTYRIHSSWKMEKILSMMNMQRMSTIEKLDIRITSQHTPAQIKMLLEICSRRGGKHADLFHTESNANLAEVEPELVAKVMTNCGLARIEKDSLTTEQIEDVLKKLLKDKCKLTGIRTLSSERTSMHEPFQAGGEMFNFADPSLVARALCRPIVVTIENTSLASRMSTDHIIAILTQIATNQDQLKVFSYILPSVRYGGSSYPSLEMLDRSTARKLTAMVREGQVEINYILPSIREAAGEAYRI